MADHAFPRDEHLTTISIAYKNPDVALIQDSVFVRTEVGKTEFSYWTYPEGQGYTVPNTRVGERSQVPRVEIQGTKVPTETEDFGVEIPLTANDINNAPRGVDPRERATEQATNLVLLDREVRCAALAFDAAQYAAGNKIDVSGTPTDMWDDYANSDPLPQLIDGIDACLMRPNVVAFGHKTWNKLSMHPKIVSAALGNDGTSGRATRQRLAELLEVQEVLVGASIVNIVKPGKTPQLARVWGPHALAFYRDRTVGTAGGITFGITGQYGTREAGSKPIDIGLRGGTGVRAGESVKEVIVAPRAAYFWQNAVAA